VKKSGSRERKEKQHNSKTTEEELLLLLFQFALPFLLLSSALSLSLTQAQREWAT